MRVMGFGWFLKLFSLIIIYRMVREVYIGIGKRELWLVH